MADNKSSEGNKVFDFIQKHYSSGANKVELTAKQMHDLLAIRKKSVGQITVDVDCSDALRGLKAIQREAKKATATLKELEEQQKRNSLMPNGGPCNPTGNIISTVDIPTDDVPDHVKRYGESKAYISKGEGSKAWFKK